MSLAQIIMERCPSLKEPHVVTPALLRSTLMWKLAEEKRREDQRMAQAAHAANDNEPELPEDW